MSRRWTVSAGLVACAMALFGRTLEFETTEVSQPALTIAPDSRSIVFNLLGHLYRLPADGGSARQLTFGPYYDSEPVFSPDGARIAFVSNRDGSDGNIYVLDIASSKITQLTREFQTGTPAWSADGKTIAFISYLKREDYPLERVPGFGGGDMGSLMTVSAQGGAIQRLSEPRGYVSVFFLPDGRLAWTVAERVLGGSPSLLAPPQIRSTTFEARSAQGDPVRLGSLAGPVGRVVMSAKGDAVFYLSGGNLRLYAFGGTDSKVIAPSQGGQARFDLSRDNHTLFAGAEAKLWRMSLNGGARQQLNWSAKVKMEVAEPLAKKWTLSTAAAPPRAVLSPRLSSDGKRLVFMAAGALWEQQLDGGQARKLIDESAFQVEPAISPDGNQLAFASDKQGKRELRVFDFATRQTRTLASVGGASWILFPSWSSDGESIVYQRSDQLGAPFKLIRVDATSGSVAELAQSVGSWTARPHLSSDGRTLYYTSRPSKIGALYRLELRAGAKPELMTDLSRHVHEGLVSPDGKWVAFRRNSEIWMARMGTGQLKDSDFQRVSSVGGRSFSFAADSSALLYSEGDHIWRRSVAGRQASEIPVRLSLPRAIAPPLLVSRVRVLDLETGKFTANTSMLVEQGRIRWIGAESGHSVPSNAVRLDGAGRYAIPGLADSHTHTAWSNQQISEDALVAYGITSVRDTGSRIDLMAALQDRGETTGLPVPRYFFSGDIFEGFMPLWGDAFLEITTPAEARSYVRHFKNLGANFIKLYASVPWYIKSAGADEARKQELPVVGHGLSTEEIVRSVILGFSSLEHNFASADDILKLLAASGVKLDPTLTIGTGTRTWLAGDPPAGIDAKFRKYVPEDAIAASRPGGSVSDQQRAAWQGTLSQILKAHRAGVKLLDGTDALMTSVFFGPSMHWELGFFNEADIPVIDVLRIATLGAAEAVGASSDLGSLEVGKLGDVVLLDGNPLEDIRNTMKIWRVVKGGQVFDPATMR